MMAFLMAIFHRTTVKMNQNNSGVAKSLSGLQQQDPSTMRSYYRYGIGTSILRSYHSNGVKTVGSPTKIILISRCLVQIVLQKTQSLEKPSSPPKIQKTLKSTTVVPKYSLIPKPRILYTISENKVLNFDSSLEEETLGGHGDLVSGCYARKKIKKHRRVAKRVTTTEDQKLQSYARIHSRDKKGVVMMKPSVRGLAKCTSSINTSGSFFRSMVG